MNYIASIADYVNMELKEPFAVVLSLVGDKYQVQKSHGLFTGFLDHLPANRISHYSRDCYGWPFYSIVFLVKPGIDYNRYRLQWDLLADIAQLETGSSDIRFLTLYDLFIDWDPLPE